LSFIYPFNILCEYYIYINISYIYIYIYITYIYIYPTNLSPIYDHSAWSRKKKVLFHEAYSIEKSDNFDDKPENEHER
jgi:hypothetical protein